MKDIFRDMWRTLARDRLRSLLTLSGIFLGAAAIVFLASALAAASFALAKSSQGETGDDLSHAHGKNPEMRSEAQTYRELSRQDVKALAKEVGIPQRDAAGGNFIERAELSRKGRKLYGSVQSGGPNWSKVGGFDLMIGRPLTDADQSTRAVLIGWEVWQQLYDGQWPVSDGFLVNGAVALQPVGVLKRKPPLGDGCPDNSCFVDHRVFMTDQMYFRVLATPGPYGELLFKHPLQENGDLADLKIVGLAMTRYLQTLHLGVKNFEFQALNEGFQLWNLVTYVLGAILFGCGLVSMVVGGVNVMNSQLMTLGERTKEFGVRRALGESARHLQLRVVVEAGVLSVAGGLLGIVAGLLAAWLLALGVGTMLADWHFKVVPWSVVAASVLSIVAGVTAGLVPAVRAGRLQPSEALRAE